MKNKRPFSLVELLIAMSLVTMVLGILFGLFWYKARIVHHLTALKQDAELVRLAHARCQTIFSNIVHGKKNQHFFFTASDHGHPSLIFTFKNGVDHEQLFSDDVLAKLFLDQDNQLVLVIWPNPEKANATEKYSMRKEILLDHVTECTMEFWKAPENNTNPVQNNSGEWITSWKKDDRKNPLMIKLRIEREDPREALVFSFVNPATFEEIIYR